MPVADRVSVVRFQILAVPFGPGEYDVHPHADRLSRGRRQVERPLGGLHHERATLSFATVRVIHVHLLNVLNNTCATTNAMLLVDSIWDNVLLR